MKNSIFKAKDDIEAVTINITIPKDTVVVVKEYSKDKVVFSPVPLIDYIDMTCPEDEFLRLFERS